MNKIIKSFIIVNFVFHESKCYAPKKYFFEVWSQDKLFCFISRSGITAWSHQPEYAKNLCFEGVTSANPLLANIIAF